MTRTEYLEYKRDQHISLKIDTFVEYGKVCTCCGENDWRFLSIDHINNDGFLEPKRHRSGVGLYYYLKRMNYPKDRYQILCMNCNTGKKVNRGVCPHKEIVNA